MLALVDGRLHLFLAHLVARDRLWRHSFVAMNAQWLGEWNLGPRAHPGDAKLDTYQADLTLSDLPKVRARQEQASEQEANNLSVRIEPGEAVGYIGANGAGKSTTLKAICGLVASSPDSIFYQGKCITGSPPFRRAGAWISSATRSGRRVAASAASGRTNNRCAAAARRNCQAR